jgi:hypothetical protein
MWAHEEGHTNKTAECKLVVGLPLRQAKTVPEHVCACAAHLYSQRSLVTPPSPSIAIRQLPICKKERKKH